MADTAGIIDILQLINSENLGAVTFYKLLEAYGSAAEALAHLDGNGRAKILPRGRAEEIFALTQERKIQILCYDDATYPAALKCLNTPPPVLYVKGDARLLNGKPAVSIVGARNASINGRKTASRIAYDLTNNGIVVVSGMARGIDAAAHKGALYAQNRQGPTIAVLGTGADVPYPAENAELYEQILRQGCVVSQFAPGTQPQAANFPRRNEIVAALAEGTLVVEATLKSGSLITAACAARYGKCLFAVPGAPAEPRSFGPNNLIRQGAQLVESAADILKVLHNNPKPTVHDIVLPELKAPARTLKPVRESVSKPALNDGKTKIIDYLNFDGVYVDEIIRASGLSSAEVALELLELEMDGKIERQSGNKVTLIKR